MFECPICQESLWRSEAQVNEFYQNLLATGNQSQVVQVVAAIREEEEFFVESGIDSSDEEDDSRPRPVVVKRNPLTRPSHFRDYLKRYYSKVVATKCGHCFHFSCLQQWCMTKSDSVFSTCPMCREQFNLNGTQVLYFNRVSEDSNAVQEMPVTYQQRGNLVKVPLLRRLRMATSGIRDWTLWPLRKTIRALDYVEQVSETLLTSRVTSTVTASVTVTVTLTVRKLLETMVPILLLLGIFWNLMGLWRLTSSNYQPQDPFEEIDKGGHDRSGEYLKMLLLSCGFFLDLELIYYFLGR